DRHGVRRPADAAEVDVVEVPQHHAVNREDLVLDVQLLAQDRAQRLRYIAVEHDEQRQALGDQRREAALDAVGKSKDAFMGRRALPAERERELTLAIRYVERGEMAADRRGKLFRVDDLLAHIWRLQHLQIAPRQQRGRARDVARVAAELHAVL